MQRNRVLVSTALLLGVVMLAPSGTEIDTTLHAQSSPPRRRERPAPSPLPPLTPLMGRILAGDYTWSTAFPAEDADLLGYANFFVKAIRRSCEEYPPSIEEELFLGGWVEHGLRADLLGPVATAATMRAIKPRAEEDAAALLATFGCQTPRLMHVMENATRLLSGRRPARGRFAKRGNLVEETTAPLGGKHLYSLDGLQSSGLAKLNAQAKDLSALGFQILECRYDRVPGDKYWHVQYYWTGAHPKVLSALSLMPVLLVSVQEGLRRANGAGVRHPYKDFGSPRSECPAAFDPALAAKEIYAPRSAVTPAPEATRVSEPVMTELPRGDRTYAYGPAPEAFVPPIPALTGPSVTLTLEKVRTGSLTRITVGSAAGAWMQLTAGNWQQWQRQRQADAALVTEDLRAISPVIARPLSRPSRRRGDLNRPDDERTTVTLAPASGTPTATSATPANPVLTCEYLNEMQGVMAAVHFWYRERPELAAPDRLRARVKDHPLLLVKAARDTCPARYADAVASR